MTQPNGSRIEAVRRATERWQKDLFDTSGHNRLLRHRDLKTSTLDLTPDRAYGLDTRALDRLLSDKPVSLSNLFPEDSDDATVFNEARRRLAAIHKVALTNLEEKGIETLFAAIGLATWRVDSGTPPNAPVILLPLEVEATGAAARDFKIKVKRAIPSGPGAPSPPRPSAQGIRSGQRSCAPAHACCPRYSYPNTR